MTKKYVAQPFKKDRVFADALKKVSKLQQETARNSSSISIKDTRSQWFKILKNVSLFLKNPKRTFAKIDENSKTPATKIHDLGKNR